MADINFLLSVCLLISFNFSLTKSTTTLTAVYKDQTPCTLCYSCDNPCHPIPLPPPPPTPPIPICPPPPSPPPPPPPALPECPPPPAPQCTTCPLNPPGPPDAIPILSGPPTVIPFPREPPTSGEFFGPPGSGGYGNNPTPYFPNYIYMPPQPSSALNSVHLKLLPIIIAAFASVTAFCCF